jgi:hypothetical protein
MLPELYVFMSLVYPNLFETKLLQINAPAFSLKKWPPQHLPVMVEPIPVPNYNLALKDARHELDRFMAVSRQTRRFMLMRIVSPLAGLVRRSPKAIASFSLW